MSIPINPNVVPLKIAIKYEPPTLGFIFMNNKNNQEFLLKVPIAEKINNTSTEEIVSWLYSTYGDVVNSTYFSKEQIEKMINKIKDNKSSLII
jgi:hypothetical protein